MRKWVGSLVVMLSLFGCSSASKTPSATLPPLPPDKYAWLEEVQGAKPLEWVKERNHTTLSGLEAMPAYRRNEKEARAIIMAKDRLPMIQQMGERVYNFWQDEKHVRGLWRRTTLAEYRKARPRWETIIDLDQLAKAESENWIYKNSNCLPPEYVRCLITLSRGGKDASVVREFDIQQRTFTKDGFSVTEAKNRVDWLDENTLLVASDFGAGSLTSSGYPRIVKLWRRGKPLAEAPTIMEAKVSDVSISAHTQFSPKGNKVLISRNVTFFEDEIFEVDPELKLTQIQKPRDSQHAGWLNGQHLVQLRSDWVVRSETFKAGSLVALSPVENAQPKVIFRPTETQSIEAVDVIKDALLITYLDSVQSRVARAHLKADQWHLEDLPIPEKGFLSVLSATPFVDTVIVRFENFLTPSTLLYMRVGIDKPAREVKTEALKSLPARFDSSPYRVDQLWATSRDGTRVPYFLIRRRDMRNDGTTPVLQYGYGGFEISNTPSYLSLIGKVWLARGGAFVMTNIRGGGEFGPKWHQAALKENRQKSFDDFIAVSEDLIKQKVTSPEHLAISGGSNGGLLVGATLTQRPELYRAATCEVPLLDMLRYNKLLAGASWEGEYGNPDDARIRPVIAKYSPYQNLKPNVKYPETFFLTSTADDRVHPAHARKMVARMQELGLQPLYFENIEGGHSAAANLEQRVKFATLKYTFLQDRLIKTK